MKNRLLVIAGIALCFGLSGCSGGDVGTGTKEAPKSAEEVKKVQQGSSASKIAHGGGAMDDGVVPGKPGEAGLPVTGAKSGGK